MLTQETKFSKFVSTFKQNGTSLRFRGPQIELKHHPWWVARSMICRRPVNPPVKQHGYRLKKSSFFNRKITSPFMIHFAASYVSLLESMFGTSPKPLFWEEMIVFFIRPGGLAPSSFLLKTPLQASFYNLTNLVMIFVRLVWCFFFRLKKLKIFNFGGGWGTHRIHVWHIYLHLP